MNKRVLPSLHSIRLFPQHSLADATNDYQNGAVYVLQKIFPWLLGHETIKFYFQHEKLKRRGANQIWASTFRRISKPSNGTLWSFRELQSYKQGWLVQAIMTSYPPFLTYVVFPSSLSHNSLKNSTKGMSTRWSLNKKQIHLHLNSQRWSVRRSRLTPLTLRDILG